MWISNMMPNLQLRKEYIVFVSYASGPEVFSPKHRSNPIVQSPFRIIPLPLDNLGNIGVARCDITPEADRLRVEAIGEGM